MTFTPPTSYFDLSSYPFARTYPAWLHQLVQAARQGQINQLVPERRPPRPGQPHPTGRPHRISAVLVLFSGDPHGTGPRPPRDARVLLTHRAATLGSHGGQVSFPGGGAEPQDRCIVDTALREAEEETGLDPRSVDVLVVTGSLYIPVSNYSVFPVLAYWRAPMAVHAADEAETTRVITAPLHTLLDPANRFVVRQQMGWKGPAFHVDDLVLWGFTAGVFAAATEVGGWDVPWPTDDVRDLEQTLAQSANGETEIWPRRVIQAQMRREMEEFVPTPAAAAAATAAAAPADRDPNPDADFRRLGLHPRPQDKEDSP